MASYKDDIIYNVEMHTVSSSDDLVTMYPLTKKENIIDLTNASTSTAGLMSTGDKSKLDGIAAGAQVNTVTGVKGNAESSYRTGNINITAANVGLGNVTNESKATMFTNAALTGTPTAPTPASSTNSTQIATTAFVQSLVGSKIAAADAMIYKGTIGSSGATVTTLPATHTTGWTYKVITAGTYAGVVCEVGDMIICLADGTTANNADWTVVQSNIDGAVTGPSSAVGDRIAVFNGTTGKVIKDSGYTIATSVPANAKFTDTTYSAATTSAAGLMSASDKTKLNNIASGAQVNQNAFSNVKVGDTTVAADSVTDTLTLIAGSNVTLTPDASGDSVTIAATDTKYTHPSYTAKSAGLYKVTVDATGHVSATTAVTKADIIALGIPGSDTNTDTKVTQTITTSDASYPILLAPSGQTATTTGTSYFDSGVTLNPSTNTIVANVSGNAATATKLATARNFRIRTGAHSVTTTFNGSSDIQMDIDVLYEAYLAWGGKNIKGDFGPLDAALIPKLGANRFAFMPTDAITIEYSTDGGTTWTDYGSSDDTKTNLVSGLGASIRIGKDETKSTTDKTNYMVRITIDAVVGKIYTVLEKFAILASTDGSTGSYCTIEGQTRQNYADGVDTWKTLVDKQTISGWSGWNIINKQIMISSISGTESSRYGAIRFVFGVTSHESTVNYAGLRVLEIMALGGVGWVTPSTMAKTGNIYSYDARGNVIFPATVTASAFSGPSATTSAKGLMGTTQVSQLNDVYTSTTTMAGVATMLNKLVSTSTAISDTTTYISMGSSNEFRTRPHSMLWTYIKGKADTVYQPKGSYLTSITKSDVTTALGYTPPTSNTDTLMTQTANTGSTALPILIGATASPSGAAAGAYAAGVTITPSSKTITATTFSGNATSATKATQDSAGQQINTTYIKALSISGKTITYTKGNGTTGTITTQDTVYTHPSYTAKSAGLYKVTVDSTGHVSATTAVTKSDITALGIPAQDTTYTLPNATSSVLGGVKVGSNITVSSGKISLTKSNVTSALGFTPLSGSEVQTLVETTIESDVSNTIVYRASELTTNAAILEALDEINTVSDSNPREILLYDDTRNNMNQLYRLIDFDYQCATFSFTNGNRHYTAYMDIDCGAVEFNTTQLLRSTKSAVVSALGYTPPKKLTFTDLTVATSDWEEDETYPDFPYKAAIACTGVTANYLAQVIFNVDEVISGIYAPVNETGDGTVSVWASELPEADIVIPTISCLL